MNATSRRIGVVALTTAQFLLLGGCFGTPSAFMKQDEAASAVIPIKKTVEAGITSGVLDPEAFYPQVLSADDGVLAGTAATFPPGALAVAAQISIQEGVPVATPALAGSLSISSGFQSTAAPVAVTTTQNLDAAKPFTIAIPIPATSTSLFSLADPYENLVVAYVVKIAATGETRTGVIPRGMLVINGNRAAFESYYFGVFQAAMTAEAVREERKADTTVMTVQTKAEQKALPAMAITGRTPFIVKEGETITLRGANFRPTIRLALNGKSVSALNLANDASLSFVAPAETSVGLVTLTAEQEGTTQDVSLVFDGKGTIPVMSGDKSKICSDVQFYDVNGALQTGTRNCNAVAVADCASDGEVGCKTNASFKAAKMANFTASSIVSGATIAGVAGTTSPSPASCASDGEVGCVTSASYKAAKMANFTASSIVSGATIAGVAGTTSPSPASCASDGEVGCVTSASYKAAKMANFAAANIASGVTIAGVVGSGTGEAHTNCGADGATGCVTTPSYPAADSAMTIAGNIKNGITIAGVTGTLQMESHSDCNTDGQIGCVVVGPTYKAADMSLITASQIKSGVTLLGIAGTHGPACTADGEIGCATNVSFPAAAMSNATPGNIRGGATIAGVAGAFPSASYPLPGADATPDLDAPTFNAKIKTGAAFEWFDSAGARYMQNGDPDLDASNIRGGFDIFGSTGTIMDCNTDGMTGCITTPTYRSADTLAYGSWDIRKGKVVGGITGQLAFYRNAAGSWNTTTPAPATSSPNEVWDTVDDYGGGTLASMFPASPAQFTMGWEIATGANWMTVSGGERDEATGLSWSMNSSMQTWANALTACDTKTDGGYPAGSWRLPTQKELMQAYTNGIWHRNGPLALVMTAYWSATTMSNTTANAWAVKLSTGETSAFSKSATYNVICVR